MEPECLSGVIPVKILGLVFIEPLLDYVLISGPVTVIEDMKCPSQLSLTEIPTPGT